MRYATHVATSRHSEGRPSPRARARARRNRLRAWVRSTAVLRVTRSSAFLVGPCRQAKLMFDANRRIAASVYIILMLGTLMCVRHCGARALVDCFARHSRAAAATATRSPRQLPSQSSYSLSSLRNFWRSFGRCNFARGFLLFRLVLILCSLMSACRVLGCVVCAEDVRDCDSRL